VSNVHLTILNLLLSLINVTMLIVTCKGGLHMNSSIQEQ